MKFFVPLIVAAVSMPVVKLGLGTSDAAAQTVEDLVGAWAWVSVETTGVDGTISRPFGTNPAGLVIFDGSGRFAWLISKSGRTKFAANNREMGTAEENKNTVHGSLAFSGSYEVKGDTLIFRIDASTYPNAEGTEQKRSITVKADELMWSNPATSRGDAGKAVLKRVR